MTWTRRPCLPLGLAAAVGSVVYGCGSPTVQGVRRASQRLGRAVQQRDTERLHRGILPSARARVDDNAVMDPPKGWSRALRRPEVIRAESLIFVEPDAPIPVVLTPEGWRFAEDPTAYYGQSTPREALRSFVRATHARRWDILLRLAPRRYRIGLSEQDLQQAWTQGDQARALGAARDRLSKHLGDPLLADSDEAALDLGDGHVARLEREGDRWVVLDF